MDYVTENADCARTFMEQTIQTNKYHTQHNSLFPIVETYFCVSSRQLNPPFDDWTKPENFTVYSLCGSYFSMKISISMETKMNETIPLKCINLTNILNAISRIFSRITGNKRNVFIRFEYAKISQNRSDTVSSGILVVVFAREHYVRFKNHVHRIYAIYLCHIVINVRLKRIYCANV